VRKQLEAERHVENKNLTVQVLACCLF